MFGSQPDRERDGLCCGRLWDYGVDSDGNEANSWSSYPPAISGDGRYVAFTSDASNLIPGDTNDAWDVFVRDRQAEATFRVSVSSSGNQANDYSVDPAISSNGRYVAFHSGATNLVIGDTNAAADVFVHDRHTGEIIRMSVDGSGNQANDFSANPAISGDSHYVAFYSGASNLVPEDTNSLQDIFVHDAGDSDDDAEWNPFDPNPNDPDCDDDAFDDGIEIYLGSDPLDACRDFPGMPGLCPGPSCNGDDAWPLDVNVDGQVSITGDVLNFVGRIGLTSGAPNWLQRLDFNGDGQISIVGDVFLYRGRIGETCT